MDIHVVYYLVVSTIMLFAGIYGFFTRKNLLAVLISVELILNATNINFAVFQREKLLQKLNHEGSSVVKK